MSALQRPLTYDDLLEMPDDGLRREVLGGELIVTPAPSIGHQRVLARLYDLLRDFSKHSGDGEVFFAPVDLRLGHFDIVQPDILYLPGSGSKMQNAQHFVEAIPQLVVEVISPSSGGVDRIRKMALYANSGIPEYWIADPVRRSLACYALAGNDYQEFAPNADGRVESRVLAGLVVDPAAIFAVLD